MADDTYDPRRAQRLIGDLRALAERIIRLDGEGRLLEETPSLLKQLGDLRSELFRYEVRTTFDTPEIAEDRRIVAEAAEGWTPESANQTDQEDGWPPASP